VVGFLSRRTLSSRPQDKVPLFRALVWMCSYWRRGTQYSQPRRSEYPSDSCRLSHKSFVLSMITTSHCTTPKPPVENLAPIFQMRQPIYLRTTGRWRNNTKNAMLCMIRFVQLVICPVLYESSLISRFDIQGFIVLFRVG
jgi:hypothetical protein